MLQASHELSGVLRVEQEPICPLCNNVRDFIEGALNTFFETEQMSNMKFCSKMLDQTQSAFDLGYYEVLNGADMRTSLTGFYRIFLGFGDFYTTAKCVFNAADLGMFAVFYNQMTKVSGNDFMAKIGSIGQAY